MSALLSSGAPRDRLVVRTYPLARAQVKRRSQTRHARAYNRILTDIGSDAAGRQAFLATWPDLDTYLLQGMTNGVLSAIGEAFAEPATDRPVRASGLELDELAGGVMIHQQTPPRVHQLNNTASIVLALCDGQRTVAAVADELAERFALASAPLAAVSACVHGLRRAGILVARTGSERPELL